MLVLGHGMLGLGHGMLGLGHGMLGHVLLACVQLGHDKLEQRDKLGQRGMDQPCGLEHGQEHGQQHCIFLQHMEEIPTGGRSFLLPLSFSFIPPQTDQVQRATICQTPKPNITTFCTFEKLPRSSSDWLHYAMVVKDFLSVWKVSHQNVNFNPHLQQKSLLCL